VSIGVATARGQSGDTFERLLAAADRTLYLAKDGGRDRVVVAEPAERSPLLPTGTQ